MREIKFRAWNEFELGEGEMITEENSGLKSYQILERFGNVMQYTGLKDENGKEIYEGDVDSLGRIVVFRDGAFMFKFKEQTNVSDVLNSHRCKYIDIIGNVHENPGLIKL